MPEGPEVKITADCLDFYLYHSKLLGITVTGGKFINNPILGLTDLTYPLIFSSVCSKGKMLIFSFTNTLTKMFVGLGMTGHFGFVKQKHTHLEFILESDPLFPNRLYFSDQRRFGNIYFSKLNLSDKLAPCLFSIEEKEFLLRAGKIKTKKDILSVLLDQEKICSGIGNYLVVEILYESKISPFRLFESILLEELSTLYKGIKKIALLSYKQKGLSISDFVLPTGQKGTFISFLQVYNKSETSKGESVISSFGSHKRTIWWVPSVQK
jgi:formamidopyrimidine-DNA glycosylase